MHSLNNFLGILCPYAPGKMDPNLRLPPPNAGTFGQVLVYDSLCILHWYPFSDRVKNSSKEIS